MQGLHTASLVMYLLRQYQQITLASFARPTSFHSIVFLSDITACTIT